MSVKERCFLFHCWWITGCDCLINPRNPWCFCGGLFDYRPFPLSHSPTRWLSRSPLVDQTGHHHPSKSSFSSSGQWWRCSRSFWARCKKLRARYNRFKEHCDMQKKEEKKDQTAAFKLPELKKEDFWEYTMCWRSSRLLDNVLKYLFDKGNTRFELFFVMNPVKLSLLIISFFPSFAHWFHASIHTQICPHSVHMCLPLV